jgi:hypothetical protein
MKTKEKRIYCSRCDYEIPVDEQRQLTGSTCALCNNMELEAHQIWQNKRKVVKPILSIVRPIKSQ